MHDTMIYQKSNYMPLTHNRYEQAFEYMFIFGKGRLKTFNPILKENKTFGENRKGTHRPNNAKKKKQLIASFFQHQKMQTGNFIRKGWEREGVNKHLMHKLVISCGKHLWNLK